ncbi:MAG: hypothetical protein IJS90_00035 [Clostridia bacterium]|nr:hypothetical protein [Clostridia bacterium]
MYNRVKGASEGKRDKTILICLIACAVFFAAVLTPAFIAASSSYRFHRFSLDFAECLVYARKNGDVVLTVADERGPVSHDTVSRIFMELTDSGMGQPIKEEPDAENMLFSLPDGSSLTLYRTPSDNGLEYPTGVTVRFEDGEGKVFMYLQRYMRYEHLELMAKAG